MRGAQLLRKGRRRKFARGMMALIFRSTAGVQITLHHEGISMVRQDNLVSIDLEMTGLEPEVRRIIEIAAIVTGSQLYVMEEGPVIAVHQPAQVLALMDDWCVRTHGESRLTEWVKDSQID